MIYILEAHNSGQANWYDDFQSNLVRGLTAAGVSRDELRWGYSLPLVSDLSSDDYVFVVHYEDLDKPEVRYTKAKVIFHHHGSGVHPYNHWIDKRAEMDHVQNVIDINTFCLPTQEKIIKEAYKLDNTVTIGFPMDFDSYKPYRDVKKKNKIVVAGHIGPERQFYLATYLLKDLLKDYEIVFSICEKEDCVTGKWSTFYDLQRFVNMGYRFVFKPYKLGFYEVLSNASHIFTCSLGDVISISVLEGYLCGCIPVVPAIFNFWPMYMDYISNGYHPFDAGDVESVVYGDKKVSVDLNWFNPERVAKRLLEKIKC